MKFHLPENTFCYQRVAGSPYPCNWFGIYIAVQYVMTTETGNIEDKQEKRSQEFYFQWHFLEMCNLRCTHCYQSAYEHGGLSETDTLKIAKILDGALAKWRKSGRISLTGGEPFLKKELMFRLMDFAEKSANFRWIGILTNGTLINDETAEQLTLFRKLKEVQVSIDGSKEETHDAIRGKGSFQKALKGLENLVDARLPTAIMFTLSNLNKGDVQGIIDLSLEAGIDALTIERITPMSTSDKDDLMIIPDELKEVYSSVLSRKKVLEQSGSRLRIRTSRPLWALLDDESGGFCPAGLSSLSILHDGTVLPCRRLEIPLGNILHDGIYKIWYTSEVLWQIRNKSNLKGKCGDCGYLKRCGGCRAIAYAVNGDIMGEDPQCWRKERVSGMEAGTASRRHDGRNNISYFRQI